MPPDEDTTGVGNQTMRVNPAKVDRLTQVLEEQAIAIQDWLRDNELKLREVPRPGEDLVSDRAARFLSANGTTAVEAAHAYVAELRSVADQLGLMAAAYRQVEDSNTDLFRQETE